VFFNRNNCFLHGFWCLGVHLGSLGGELGHTWGSLVGHVRSLGRHLGPGKQKHWFHLFFDGFSVRECLQPALDEASHRNLAPLFPAPCVYEGLFVIFLRKCQLCFDAPAAGTGDTVNGSTEMPKTFAMLFFS